MDAEEIDLQTGLVRGVSVEEGVDEELGEGEGVDICSRSVVAGAKSMVGSIPLLRYAGERLQRTGHTGRWRL